MPKYKEGDLVTDPTGTKLLLIDQVFRYEDTGEVGDYGVFILRPWKGRFNDSLMDQQKLEAEYTHLVTTIDTGESEWAGRARAKLESLRNLEADSIDFTPPDERALSRAAIVLERLIEQDFKPKRISPMADGGVTIVLRLGDHTSQIVCTNVNDTQVEEEIIETVDDFVRALRTKNALRYYEEF